jgi:RNA polymerase sigma-70 factor (ECF subfamily)
LVVVVVVELADLLGVSIVVVLVVEDSDGGGVVVLGTTTVVSFVVEAVVVGAGVVVEVVVVRSQAVSAVAPRARAATRAIVSWFLRCLVVRPNREIRSHRREFHRDAKNRAFVGTRRHACRKSPTNAHVRIRCFMPTALQTVDAVYRSESRRVLATLIRLLGDFDIAEEALHDAFAAAVEQWPVEGVPQNPRAWLVSAGRFKAIDRIRRRARFEVQVEDESELAQAVAADAAPDDREGRRGRSAAPHLHLLPSGARSRCPGRPHAARGLRHDHRGNRERVPHLPATVAQRIVRAKAKIRDARIPYEVPGRGELPGRLDSVLRAIYLVFNEGYLASSGEALTRHDLSGEAIRLGRLLVELLPEPEAVGLLALMLLQESRRAARTSTSGEIVLLADQDRSLWNRAQIDDGTRLVEGALTSGGAGVYSIQAAIAAVHAAAPDAAATDWAEIVGLYDALLRAEPSPVVELNRAVAVAMRDGPEAGLALVDELLERGDLGEYRLAHATRADLCRRIGRTQEARTSYRRALELTQQASERRFLERRLAELAGPG